MNLPVRVLQVLMCDDIGGTEAMLAALLERMDRNVVVSELATFSGPGPVAARVAASGLRVRALGDGASLPVATARLARVLRGRDFHVVNAYGFKATFIARAVRAAVDPGSHFVCGVRGLHVSELEDVDSTKARAIVTLERLASPLVDIYDANSRGALEFLAERGVPRRKLRYIPNGLDIAAWPAMSRVRTEPPDVLCVARFVPRKRHIDLIEAAESLVERGVGFRLVLVGTGPTLDAVRARARAGPAADRIEFTGALDRARVYERLAAAQIFALPSLWEGMAGSVMEAMASGLPVVGTRVNGIADLVDDGRTGRLVSACQPEALADALAELLGNVSVGEQMGAAGRERIAREFSLDAMAAAKAALYVELAGAH
jgi:glycosyltransferase involved in cell wall biosynthesis